MKGKGSGRKGGQVWGTPGNGPRNTGTEGRRDGGTEGRQDVFAGSAPEAVFLIAWCHVVQQSVTELPSSLWIASFVHLKSPVGLGVSPQNYDFASTESSQNASFRREAGCLRGEDFPSESLLRAGPTPGAADALTIYRVPDPVILELTV